MATILVIDDDENNRLLLATLMEYAGHTLLEASTAASGLAVALDVRPDVVVVDLSLPDMSGPELLRRLRAEPALEQTRLALYTATESAGLAELVDRFKIGGRIPKPGTPQEILAAFGRLLNPT